MATKITAKKPVAKPVSKPVVKASKPAAKPVAKKPVAKAPAKPAPKPVAKAPAKPVAKKAVKPVAKAPSKPVQKTTSKPAAKAPVKPVKIAVVKKEVAKPVAKAPAKAEPKPMKKVEVKEEKKVKKVEVVAEKAVKVAEVVAKPEGKKPRKTKAPKTITAKQYAKVKEDKAKKAGRQTKVQGVEKATTIIPVKQLAPKPKYEPVTKEVKIPKTTVKTAIDYTPGYVPMDRRETKALNTEPSVRYSDYDLNEFKELITKKLETAKKELGYLQGLITRKDDQGGDNEDGRYMTMDDGSLSMEREQLSQMASRQITFIDHLEKALIRIESKTYGICRVTGKLIDKARLRAVPHATLSLEAKLGLVKSGD